MKPVMASGNILAKAKERHAMTNVIYEPILCVLLVCGGVNSREAMRELGANLLKAAVRTVAGAFGV